MKGHNGYVYSLCPIQRGYIASGGGDELIMVNPTICQPPKYDQVMEHREKRENCFSS
jgi:hypothetical protein